MWRPLRNRLRAWLTGGELPTWYDPRYRLPMASIEARLGIEPRRADFALAYLVDIGQLRESETRRPLPVSYRDLARVHSHRMLEALGEPETLARVFAVDPADVHVEETLLTVRLACGATVEAAREALSTRRPMFNLLGGFHHAEPDRAAILCAVNDIAVAVAALRSEGFAGRIAVLDLDAHPPDGTAACLRDDAGVWIGSLSGSDWGRVEGVDETVLPAGSDDETYLHALTGLLSRMPPYDLAFVIAGGDVLAGDRLGALGLSLAGVRERDLEVARALAGTGSVWLPGGGYHTDAWKVLAGTWLAIAVGSREPLHEDYDALRAHYAKIARSLDTAFGHASELREEDILSDLGVRPAGTLLGYYTASGVEHALERYGILQQLRRLGYERFEVEIANEGRRDRARLFGQHAGQRLLLIECLLEELRIADKPVLFVHWVLLQDAARSFDARTAPLPGQEHPGLGLSREIGELFARMAERLGLAGIAFRPSWYHTAYAARHRCGFVDAARQGRFEALVRDLAGIPLSEATKAVAEERITMNGRAYRWEADEMVSWLDEDASDEPAVRAERERVHFTLGARAA